MTKHNYPTDRKPTGPRPTAGRKSKLINPKRVTLWLEAEQVNWLENQGDKSEVIRNIIDKERTNDNDKQKWSLENLPQFASSPL